MARAINIEILRLKRMRHTALIMGFCALLLACLITALPGTQASYTYDDERQHVFVFDEDSNVAVTLKEPGWTFGADGYHYDPGDVVAKDPTITNAIITKDDDGNEVTQETADCYMRVMMRITDIEGNTLDPVSGSDKDKDRVQKILKTLYYDTGTNIQTSGTKYTKAQMDALVASGSVKSLYNSDDFSV